MQEALDRAQRENPPTIEEADVLGKKNSDFQITINIFRIFGICTLQTGQSQACTRHHGSAL